MAFSNSFFSKKLMYIDFTKWWISLKFSPKSPIDSKSALVWVITSQIIRFMGPTWGPPGSCRPQMGPMLAPWTSLSGLVPNWKQTMPEPMMIHFNDALLCFHHSDVIMGATASQITSLTSVFSAVYSDANQRKHQSSASLAFVRGIHRGPVNSPHKWPVTRKMFPFDDVIMLCTETVTELAFDLGPLELTWISSNLAIDKELHPL